MLHALCLSALLTGQSADVITSLQHTHGYHEVNPLLPQRSVPFVLTKAGLTTATAIAGWKLRHDHPKLAVVVFLAGATTGALAAIHNARLR